MPDFFDPKTFYFELPLYTSISITQDTQYELRSFLQNSSPLDYYNPTLGENSTYQVNPIYNFVIREFMSTGGMAYALLTCVRTGEKYYFFYYYDSVSKVFMKIGQYPSIATFHIVQVKKYNKVLGNDKLKEFTRAIGLAANGIGIGSFVYLRRIFEGLIEEAHVKAQVIEGWDERAYTGARMAEKIEFLRDHLPTFLVENKALYGILSVGIHSLKEEDCLAYFETVKVGIELILDEKLEVFKKEKKIGEARQKLAALSSSIKSK